jgi:hypothetical protein
VKHVWREQQGILIVHDYRLVFQLIVKGNSISHFRSWPQNGLVIWEMLELKVQSVRTLSANTAETIGIFSGPSGYPLLSGSSSRLMKNSVSTAGEKHAIAMVEG